MAEDDDDQQIAQYRQAFEDDGWRGVIRLADLARDAREKHIVGLVEKFMEQLIRDTHEENPTTTVRDVRAHLFEVPQ